MNSNVLKITGSAELSEPLELSKDYLISVNCGIDSVKKQSDEQGGFEYIYSARLRTCEILKDNGKIMKAKVKGSMSKKIRREIELRQPDYKPDMDTESFYQLVQSWVLENIDEIIKKAI